MTLYSTFKLIHVLAGIVAVGFNLTYPVWLLKSRKEEKHLLYSLEGIKILDNWIANPSYLISLCTGLWMSVSVGYDLMGTKWIVYSLIIYGLMSIIGFGIYTPLLSKQISVLKSQGSDSDNYKQLDKKQTILGLILYVCALSIVFFMIIKPI